MVKELVFTVNGPGELNGLVFPLIRAFRQKFPELICSLYAVPCQFSAGTETDLAKTSGLFDYVFTTAEYRKYMFRKNWPKNYWPAEQGVVFYCGGDSWHAKRLSKKYGWPLYGYDEGSVTNKRWFVKLFNRDLDGNLMVDAALGRDIGYQAVPIGAPELTVGLYPGSRERHLCLMLGFFGEVAELLKKKYPYINFRWGVNSELREFVDKNFPQRFAAPYEQAGNKYDLIVSLTGTNTAISAALGIPLLVLLPFNNPDLIPFSGLLGLISDIPVLGRPFKKLLITCARSRLKFISIPNIKAGCEVVPELVGYLTPQQVMQKIEHMLLDIEDRRRMHDELPACIGKPGAQNIVKYFEEILK